MANTRAAFEASHAKILKECDSFTPSTSCGINLVDVAKSTLEEFGNDPAPIKEEVLDFISSRLPDARSLFDEEMLLAEIFPVYILRKVTALYQADPLEDANLNALGLTVEDKKKRRLVLWIWMAKMVELDKNVTMRLVHAQKTLTGYGSIFVDPVISSAPPVTSATNEGTARLAQSEAGPSTSNSVGQDARSIPGVGNLLPTFREDGMADQKIPPPTQGYDLAKKAAGVQAFFKDEKFTGDINESIELTVKSYEVCASQLQLSSLQKATFFVNALGGAAKDYFLSNVKPEMTFLGMVTLMKEEYNSDARQLQVQSILNCLSLQESMQKLNTTDSTFALSDLVTTINSLTPQTPVEFRSDAHKIMYLKQAVISYDWAKVPISQIMSHKYTFNSFVTALRGSLQLNEEIQKSEIRTPSTTLYGQYGRNPRYVRKYDRPRHPRYRNASRTRFVQNRGQRSNNRSIGPTSIHQPTCWGCGKPGHKLRDNKCAPGDVKKYIMQELKGGASKTYLLTNLVRGMEGEDDQESLPAESNEPFPGNNDSPSADDGQGTQVRFADIDDHDSSEQDDLHEQLFYANHISSSISHEDEQDF